MMSRLHFPALLRNACAGAMLAALCTQPALAGDAKTTNVKLRIGVAFTETIRPSDSTSCPGLIGEISGTGYSTELGAVGIRSTDCFVPDPTGTTLKFFTNPRVTLTTLGGDEIWGTYEGTATGAPLPIISISANLMIAGGTGRYVNASGTASIEGIENIGSAPAVGVLVISGKLSY